MENLLHTIFLYMIVKWQINNWKFFAMFFSSLSFLTLSLNCFPFLPSFSFLTSKKFFFLLNNFQWKFLPLTANCSHFWEISVICGWNFAILKPYRKCSEAVNNKLTAFKPFQNIRLIWWCAFRGIWWCWRASVDTINRNPNSNCKKDSHGHSG